MWAKPPRVPIGMVTCGVNGVISVSPTPSPLARWPAGLVRALYPSTRWHGGLRGS